MCVRMYLLNPSQLKHVPTEQVMYALFMLFLWAKVVKDMKEEMGRRPVIRPARGTVASRNASLASYAKAPVNSMSSAKSYKRS